MITYKGLPAPLVCDFLSREQSRSHYAPGTEFHIGKIEMVANTGTYLDSPFHRYATGKDLSELPLEPGEPGRRRDLCRPIERPGRQSCGFQRPRPSRQGGSGPHRLGYELAHGPVFRGPSLP